MLLLLLKWKTLLLFHSKSLFLEQDLLDHMDCSSGCLVSILDFRIEVRSY